MSNNDPDWGSPSDEELLRKARRDLDRERPRRDVGGIVLAVILLVFSAGLALGAVHGGWWMLLWIPAFFLLVVGTTGLVESIRKTRRDEKGNPL